MLQEKGPYFERYQWRKLGVQKSERTVEVATVLSLGWMTAASSKIAVVGAVAGVAVAVAAAVVAVAVVVGAGAVAVAAAQLMNLGLA